MVDSFCPGHRTDQDGSFVFIEPITYLFQRQPILNAPFPDFFFHVSEDTVPGFFALLSYYEYWMCWKSESHCQSASGPLLVAFRMVEREPIFFLCFSLTTQRGWRHHEQWSSILPLSPTYSQQNYLD